MVIFPERLLVAGRMGGYVVTGEEVCAGEIVLAMGCGHHGIQGVQRGVEVLRACEESVAWQLSERLFIEKVAGEYGDGSGQ